MYHDSEIVDGLMSGIVWQGMTTDMLIEAWGEPIDIDVKVYKTKGSRSKTA